MSTDDRDATVYPFTPAPPPAVGPTPPRRRRSRLTKTAVGLALILGTGTGAAAVAVATTGATGPALASDVTTTTSAAGPNVPGAPNLPGRPFPSRFGRLGGPGGPGKFGFGGPGAMAGALGMLGILGPNGVVHGTFTVKGPSGSYETIAIQSGTVSSVDTTSSPETITVLSADNFSQTYDANSSTVVYADYNGLGSIKTSDNVTIEALVSGSTYTAQRIVDATQVQANRKSWVPSPGKGPWGGPPTSTTTTTTSP